MKVTKHNLSALTNDVRAVIESLETKKKYLTLDKLPTPLTANNLLDEDIDYLKNEILPKINDIDV